jgi:hypothetical protein
MIPPLQIDAPLGDPPLPPKEASSACASPTAPPGRNRRADQGEAVDPEARPALEADDIFIVGADLAVVVGAGAADEGQLFRFLQAPSAKSRHEQEQEEQRPEALHR